MFQILKLLTIVLALLVSAQADALKAFPEGVFECAGPVRHPTDNVVAQTPLIAGQEGVC